jgi:PAS domain S-box-containing protein
MSSELHALSWRAVLEAASDAVFVVDASLSIAWCNARAAELVRGSAEELVGRPIAELVWDEDEVRKQKEEHAAMRAGAEVRRIRRIRACDGALVLAELSSRLVDGYIVTVGRDVGARLEAEARLARSEASFRALIEHSPDGIGVHREGRFVYVNPAMVRLLGWSSPADLIGKPVLDIVHPDDREAVARRVRALAAGASNVVPFSEERLLAKDGSVHTVSIAGVAIVFDGEPSVVAIGRDVTEQRRLQAQLAQADRLASLGALAAGVGHEINNPLTYVMLRLEALGKLSARLREGGVSDASALADQLDAHVAAALEGVGRVRHIVKDLRVLARSPDDEPEALDVRGPIGVAIDLAAHEVRQRARLVVDEQPVPFVRANEGRLVQVFLNLLVNAAHAIPEGAPERHEIRIRTRYERGLVTVAVIDDGEGIAPDDLPRVFEPFYTTKATGSGSGLGLAVCHGIVSGLGGALRVTSERGKGSTFVVELPPATAPAARRAAREESADRAYPSKRLLVVDDEPAILRSLTILLAGHEVVTAGSVDEAIRVLGADPGFDVVLTDVRMPGKSGLELHAWLREHAPELAERTLFMSGGAGTEEERKLSERQERQWIGKPFDAATLEARLDEVARRGR